MADDDAGDNTAGEGKNNDQTLGALEIVQNHFVLSARKNNANLQKLSDEIADIYNPTNTRSDEELRRDLRMLNVSIDDTLQQYKERRERNLMFEEGRHVKNNSWCPHQDAYVYDPHIRGKASFYDTCSCDDDRCPRRGDDGAIYPALIQPTGDVALLVVLGDTAIVMEWRLLNMENYCLGTKVDNQIRQLCLNFKSKCQVLNQNFPALLAEDNDETGDAVYDEEIEEAGDVLDNDEEDDGDDVSSSSSENDGDDEEETDDNALDESELRLSQLSDDDLANHMIIYNLELRQIIANANAFIGAMDTQFYARSYEFFDERREEFLEQLEARSIKSLPRKKDITFDPLQEMENLYLSEKLEGTIMLLIAAVYDKEVFGEEFGDLFEEVDNLNRFRFL